MAADFKTHLEKIGFEKYLKKLVEKIGKKKIIIYGTGAFFQYIQKNYDLSGLNIIGVSDMKFSENQEGTEYLGYKIIPKNKMIEYKPDYILVAALEYLKIIEDFQINMFYKTGIKVYPLARIPLWQMIRKIWES